MTTTATSIRAHFPRLPNERPIPDREKDIFVSIGKLKAIFVDVLDVDTETDWANVRYQETPGWDSVAHMSMVAEIEDEFDIMLEVDDVLDMSSFDKAIEIVQKYGAASS